jgi:hypothetical protein
MFSGATSVSCLSGIIILNLGLFPLGSSLSSLGLESGVVSNSNSVGVSSQIVCTSLSQKVG